MPPRPHPLVQHAHDLDDPRFYHAIEDHMHRLRNRRLAAFVPAVADVEAANAGPELGAIHG